MPKPINNNSEEKHLNSVRWVMEKRNAEIGRMLRRQNFKSAKEANAFLEKNINSATQPGMRMTPLERAQDLMYNAWDASGKKRIDLALQAIGISKDCADAYVLLAGAAMEKRKVVEARTLFELGLEAGERALGKKAFLQYAGHFWGITETRPYMRARQGLANALWVLGEHAQAITHYADMLRLNPNDNQGIRYILLNCLLEGGRDVEARVLLNTREYADEASADWSYPKALWAFRVKDEKATEYLKEALEANKLVPVYLLGKKKIPSMLPEYISLGGEDEAASYASAAYGTWQKTPGALDWLKAALEK